MPQANLLPSSGINEWSWAEPKDPILVYLDGHTSKHDPFVSHCNNNPRLWDDMMKHSRGTTVDYCQHMKRSYSGSGNRSIYFSLVYAGWWWPARVFNKGLLQLYLEIPRIEPGIFCVYHWFTTLLCHSLLFLCCGLFYLLMVWNKSSCPAWDFEHKYFKSWWLQKQNNRVSVRWKDWPLGAWKWAKRWALSCSFLQELPTLHFLLLVIGLENWWILYREKGWMRCIFWDHRQQVVYFWGPSNMTVQEVDSPVEAAEGLYIYLMGVYSRLIGFGGTCS